ncbi:DUF362 domain-containing protein [candidate division KSB1 bacterium]|nr:DUF362 domain-containing protein [candidate division KSB1 bacterium]NIR71206.1 DUF362 domain-containing protein [candidate division KSB1 bacterium]NIS23310.1 DUF362 domain-containing protein [candidate division KSB1 bacterium]NIT70189.1 DUF362 domain-containing protein [candidate division KSB1 bacterium]NIU23841.1 DUF362 domain-containing protein [candidate division KSB1 bacterium]
MTRRELLKLGASAAVAFGAPPILTNCGGCGGKESITNPAKINASVAAVRGDDLSTITHSALEALGGIEKVVNKGHVVFIKPNFVSFPWARTNNCFAIGECTKPEIIIAVTEECLKAGAAEVIIGDGSHLPTFDWQYATTFDGSTNLVLEAERLRSKYRGNVTLACLETDSPAWDEVPSRTYLGKIAISSLVARADRVISIPVAKTHSWAQLTLSLKNFIGITPLDRYAAWVNNSYWDRGKVLDHSSPKAIAQIYLDIVDAVRPDLAIIDFSIGLEGDGPTLGSGSRTVNMKHKLGSWLVLASTDLMAADATAARIMSHNVADMKQLTMGYEMGLGEIREEAIELLGEKLDDLRVDWLPAKLKNRLGLQSDDAPVCPFAYQMAHHVG